MNISDKCKRDGSSGLFPGLTFFVAACAAALVPVAANAAAYTEGMNSITLTVTDGTTNTFAEAIAAYNADNNTSYTVSSFNGGELKDYALIKEGDGTLKMDEAIANFTGPIVIKDGVLKCMCTYALGADTTDSHVYVRDGATFYVRRIADSEDIKNNNRNLHIAGDGHNGQGALNVDKARKSNSYNPTGIYGKTLSLDGNATVVHPSWAHLGSPVNLNGHTLVVKSPDSFSAGSAYCNATYQATPLNGPGKMVIDDSIYYLQGSQLNDTSAGNELEIRNNGGFRFWKSNYTGYNWIFRFTGETAWIFGDNSDGWMRFALDGNASVMYNSERNRIGSPMILEGTTLKMRTQSGIPDNWIFLTGPISGNGNINLECETWQAFPAHRLSLLNPANSFTGTATVDKGLLYVYEPGTLPSTVSLVVSRSHALDYKLQKTTVVPEYFGAEFLSPNPQTLNTLTFTSVTNKENKVYQSGRIQGGCGTFSRIDKLSPNTMEYYSGIGSPLLNVEEGTVKLPRGPAPGLWEGTNRSAIASSSSNWGAVFTDRKVATNLVARGPLLANCPLFPHFAARFNMPVTYSGYIWNRYGQDVTVTLVSSINAYAKLYIDDEPIFQQDTYTAGYNQMFTNLTLATGPHKFEYRTHSGGTCVSNGWDRSLGFAIDPLARGASSDTNNFMAVIDPGDGSIFTRSIDEADLPHFDEMRFADGTTLDLNGNAYVAGSLSGLPEVISSATDALADPSLTITNKFTVNAADLAAGKKLSLAMPLTFGENASVTVTNLTGVARRQYVLAETSGEGNAVTASSRIRHCTTDYGKWTVEVSANGKQVVLAPASGFMFHLR